MGEIEGMKPVYRRALDDGPEITAAGLGRAARRESSRPERCSLAWSSAPKVRALKLGRGRS